MRTETPNFKDSRVTVCNKKKKTIYQYLGLYHPFPK